MRFLAVLGCLGVLAVACAGDDDSGGGDDGGSVERSATTAAAGEPDAATFPGDEWSRADPAELGIDDAALDRIAADAEALQSDCLLVIRDGQLVGEWYWRGTDAGTRHQVWSVTKSYSSTLVGIAQDEALLDVDDEVSTYVPEWVGTPSEEVTIRNILSNDSGRRSSAAGGDMETMAGFINAPDRTAYVRALEQVAPPGTVWSNNEAAIQMLEPVLEAATGVSPAAYAREKLLGPIGADGTEMTMDPAGNTNMPAFLETTCEDAARLGHLFLHNGNWDGTQVVSEEWVATATQPSQDLNGGYGFLWWLNTPREMTEFVDSEQLAPGAPEDLYWARGAFGQVIQIHPSTGTVVVRFGEGESILDPAGWQLTTRVVTEAIAD